MNGVILRGAAYILLGVMGVWGAFFTQYYEAWLQDPSTQLNAPWFVWVSLGINSMVAALVVFRAFVDGSAERARSEPHVEVVTEGTTGTETK